MAADRLRFRRFLYDTYSRFVSSSQRRRWRLTEAGRLAALVTVTAAIVGANTNAGTTYQLFTLLIALFAASSLHSGRFRPRLRIRRRAPAYATAGEVVRYRLRVENLANHPIANLRVSEVIDEPIPAREDFLHRCEPGESGRNAFDRTLLWYRWMWLTRRLRRGRALDSTHFDLAANDSAEIEVTVEPLHRGVLSLAEVKIARPDLFGLVDGVRRVEAQEADTITILPKRHPLPRLALGGGTRYQNSGSVLAGNVGHSDEFIGLRDYRPGDPLRHLHWKSWARTGRPIVREFEDEYFPRFALALDTFAPYDCDARFEAAVSVAASFVCKLDTKESLLDLLFVGSRAYCFTSGRGAAQPQRLLDVLAAVELNPEKSFAELDVLLRSRVRDVGACILVLLDWDDVRRECARRLRAGGAEVLVLVLWPADVPTPSDGVADGVRFVPVDRVAEELARL